MSSKRKRRLTSRERVWNTHEMRMGEPLWWVFLTLHHPTCTDFLQLWTGCLWEYSGVLWSKYYDTTFSRTQTQEQREYSFLLLSLILSNYDVPNLNWPITSANSDSENNITHCDYLIHLDQIEPVSVTSFINRIVAGVIKLRVRHTGLEWSSIQ